MSEHHHHWTQAASQAYEECIVHSLPQWNKTLITRPKCMPCKCRDCFHVNEAQAVDLTYACGGSSVTVRYFKPLLSMCSHILFFSSEGMHALMFCSAEMKNTCMVLLTMCAHYHGISMSITYIHAIGHCIHLWLQLTQMSKVHKRLFPQCIHQR